ncbi:MAG: DNA methyltransferase [Anaerolineales bacterium]|nr:DNA methyltransferase [Anaerolineales bacterium]
MPNAIQTKAKNAKNDEFYTQYADIEKEISAYLEFDPDVFRGKTVFLPCDDPEWSNFTKYFAQNFEKFGLKKLISTSYAVNSKNYKDGYQPTLFETSAPYFDKVKTVNNGKIFTLTHDKTGDHKVNVDDLEWHYLEGDGDFRSNEIKKLRDESDIIITNPPFSLFREFLAWIIEVEKQFVIIGNMNAIAYKEVFPLIENDKMWMGNGFNAGNAYFSTPFAKDYGEGVYNPETGLVKFRNVCWFTNLDHGRRHQPLPLMTMADNLKFSKHKEIKGKKSYDSYDNYDAIEVPYTDSIPSDYDGVMGVPISFLNKYSPEQFEILGITQRGCHDKVPDTKKYDDYWEVQPNGKKTGSSGGKTNENPNLVGNDGKKNYFTNKEGVVIQSVYQRIFIRHRKSTK